jgi:hypothetical protein
MVVLMAPPACLRCRTLLAIPDFPPALAQLGSLPMVRAIKGLCARCARRIAPPMGAVYRRELPSADPSKPDFVARWIVYDGVQYTELGPSWVKLAGRKHRPPGHIHARDVRRERLRRETGVPYLYDPFPEDGRMSERCIECGDEVVLDSRNLGAWAMRGFTAPRRVLDAKCIARLGLEVRDDGAGDVWLLYRGEEFRAYRTFTVEHAFVRSDFPSSQRIYHRDENRQKQVAHPR